MRTFAFSALVTLGFLCGTGLIVSAADPPAWAYLATPKGFEPDPDDGAPKQLAGSSRSYTHQQVKDRFNPADWYPDEHPPMPDVPVAHGRPPSVMACSWCHLPNGLGHPQSANIAGLPSAYFLQQLADFKSGARKPSVGGSVMTTMAKELTDEEAKASADYFAAVKRTPWVSVVEASEVPKTRMVEGNLRIALDSSKTEPLGQRIIEVPVDPVRARLYDSHAGFKAYVPVGSVKRGEELVATGSTRVGDGTPAPARTIPCAACHGVDFRGLAYAPGAITPVPLLAGQSPIYIVRQLFDFQSGARTGPGAGIMIPVVARLSGAGHDRYRGVPGVAATLKLVADGIDSTQLEFAPRRNPNMNAKGPTRRRFLKGAAMAGLAAVGGARETCAQEDWRSKLPPLPDPNLRTEFVPEDKIPMDHVLRDPWTGEPLRDSAGDLIVDWTGTPQWAAYNKNIKAAGGRRYGLAKDTRLYGERSRFDTTYRRGLDGAGFSWMRGGGSGRPIQPTSTAAEFASLETPLEAQLGIITPSGLHFVDEHGENPEIDPRQHRLTIHGMVDRPITYTMEDLYRLPSVSRVHFIDCNSNSTTSHWTRLQPWATAGNCFSEGSCSEWTGVLLSTLLEATGLKKGAKWFYASAADGYNQSWAIPIWKALDDAIIAYGQNGEWVRPEQGFPVRLLLPGFQGTMMIKRLRSIKVTDELAQFHREYREQFPDNKITWFRLEHPPKSCILRPSGGMQVPKGGFYEIRGVAWSGGGKIAKVEVTLDGGKTWKEAQIQPPVFSKAHTRFVFPWSWTGQETIIASRCTDERGSTQPTTAELARIKDKEISVAEGRNLNTFNRFNAPQPWKIDRQGKVTNAIFAI